MKTTVTPAQLAAQTARMLENVKPAAPADGREVVAVCLSPRTPDGKGGYTGGEVQKVIRVGPKPERRFAEPQPYWETDTK